MYGLENFLTDDTIIYYLKRCNKTNLKELYNLSSGVDTSMVYSRNEIDYFFKSSPSGLFKYLVNAFNEFIGEYYSEILEARSVKYHIARTESYDLGICSEAFNEKEKEYSYIQRHILDFKETRNVKNFSNNKFDFFDYLVSLCIDEKNKEQFIDSLLKMFAIDLYMLQRDRDSKNMEFERDLNNGYFNLAPLYDFEDCHDSLKEFRIYNSIIELTRENVNTLIKRYESMHDYLKKLCDIPIDEVLDNIFQKYGFNKNIKEYEEIKYFYEQKESRVKKYIAKLI